MPQRLYFQKGLRLIMEIQLCDETEQTAENQGEMKIKPTTHLRHPPPLINNLCILPKISLRIYMQSQLMAPASYLL